MDGSKLKSLFEKVEKSVSCCVAQSIDVGDLNVTKCCGALLSTEWYAALLGNNTATCPYCRGRLSQPLHLPWSKDLLNDLQALRTALDLPNGGRPPVRDSCCQTQDPNRMIVMPMPVLEMAFTQFSVFIGKAGGCYLTGEDLKCLRTLAMLSRNLAINQNDSMSHLGLLLYRFLYTGNASIFHFGHFAELFAKLDAPLELVISAALPKPFMRPQRITDKRDTVMYAFLWLKPFTVHARNEIVPSLLESFGILGVELDVDPCRPHADRGGCNECLKCKLQNGIRVQIRHQLLNDTPKDYLMQCALCGEVVDWRLMDRHVRKHKGQRYQRCHSCMTPVSGPCASDKPHVVECPFRLFPIGPDDNAHQYRRPPMPLRMNAQHKPDYPGTADPVYVRVDVEMIRGKPVAVFTWD